MASHDPAWMSWNVRGKSNNFEQKNFYVRKYNILYVVERFKEYSTGKNKITIVNFEINKY